MEEDIKILENLINVLNTGLCKFGENVRMNDCGYQEAIENLLKRYKELEEENAMLKKANNIAEDVTVEDITQVVNKSLEEFKREFIPISVIQNKIEWLKLIADNGMNAVRFACSKEDEIERIQKQKDINTMINILQELLEERR